MSKSETGLKKGSKNVFRELGFDEQRAAELTLKSALLLALQDAIRARQLTQSEAAQLLGVDQAKVSKILAGRLAGFSVERLVRYLSRLGHDVEVRIRRTRRGRRQGRILATVA